MKKMILIILVGFLTLTAFKTPKKIIGNWKVIKLENNGNLVENKPFEWLEIKENGNLKIGIDNKSIVGNWKYEKKNKKMILITNVKNTSKEFKILELSKKKLTLLNSSSTIYLEKNN